MPCWCWWLPRPQHAKLLRKLQNHIQTSEDIDFENVARQIRACPCNDNCQKNQVTQTLRQHRYVFDLLSTSILQRMLISEYQPQTNDSMKRFVEYMDKSSKRYPSLRPYTRLFKQLVSNKRVSENTQTTISRLRNPNLRNRFQLHLDRLKTQNKTLREARTRLPPDVLEHIFRIGLARDQNELIGLLKPRMNLSESARVLGIIARILDDRTVNMNANRDLYENIVQTMVQMVYGTNRNRSERRWQTLRARENFQKKMSPAMETKLRTLVNTIARSRPPVSTNRSRTTPALPRFGNPPSPRPSVEFPRTGRLRRPQSAPPS